MATLKAKQDELQAVQDRLAKLQSALDEKVWQHPAASAAELMRDTQLQEKDDLEAKVSLCAQKLQRAQKLIGIL